MIIIVMALDEGTGVLVGDATRIPKRREFQGGEEDEEKVRVCKSKV